MNGFGDKDSIAAALDLYRGVYMPEKQLRWQPEYIVGGCLYMYISVESEESENGGRPIPVASDMNVEIRDRYHPLRPTSPPCQPAPNPATNDD